jgi:dihydroorotase
MESYAAVFEEEGALDKLEAFASENGPRFYRMPPNEDRVTLERVDTPVPTLLALDGVSVVPFHAGETLRWRYKA